ncbi:two-component system response regulator ResD [Solirubrobacter pauli]|uniref:Two-component system response regulator ResD n=1 Tax=Solirubrobacter pauli TaxID=166793 RepID=A0A660L730_9ACTN|nr:response regulator transcription factor [Solirubrobacter pauli]RKQ90837.1 two-component system response regulator ResD [Solirubrobacter pauli]
MPSTHSILLAEEDPVCRTFLADNLAADGYDVVVAIDKRDALVKLHLKPDLVLCDVNGETIGLVDAVRQEGGFASRVDPLTPLIVLSRKADALMCVRLLEHGCDDVIRKPFSYRELLARVQAVLRRSQGQLRTAERVVQIGPLEIDTVSRTARISGQLVEFATKELALLTHMAGDPNRVFTKDELLRDVWGYRARGRTRTLDAHALKVRHKLRNLDETHWMENVWGVGYRLLPSRPFDEASAA